MPGYAYWLELPWKPETVLLCECEKKTLIIKKPNIFLLLSILCANQRHYKHWHKARCHVADCASSNMQCLCNGCIAKSSYLFLLISLFGWVGYEKSAVIQHQFIATNLDSKSIWHLMRFNALSYLDGKNPSYTLLKNWKYWRQLSNQCKEYY